MNHTPGPWTLKTTGTIDDQPAQWDVIGAGGIVGDVQSVNPADARVIAAAPDLLNACIRALLLLSDPEADENEADRVTLVLVDALRLAGALDSKLELT